MAEIGWQKIGEIADVIGKGIERILQELREILNHAGEAAGNQLDRIENFVRDVFIDLPGSIQREFPGSLRGRTLAEIRKLCGKQR